MGLKRLSSNSNLAQQIFTFEEEIQVKGFAMRLADATQVGQLLPWEIGRMVYTKNGHTLVDVGSDALMALGNLMGGYSENESGNGAVLENWIYIPRRFKNDNNVELIKPSDKAQIRITFGSDVAVAMAAATENIEIYADMEDGIQKYELEILQVSATIGGTGNTPFAVQANNILMIVVSDVVSNILTFASSNITQITLDIGGRHHDMSVPALLSDTQYHHRVETETELVGVIYDTQGTISGKLHDEARLKFTTSGSANPQVITLGAKFNNARTKESTKIEINKVRAAIARKAERGDTDTIQAVQRFAGGTA